MGAGAAGVCVLTWFVGLSWYDIQERRLPNWLTVPGAIVILSCAATAGHGAAAVAGALSLFAVYLVPHLIAPAAIGAGDVKLAIGIGALTGAFGIDVWLVAALGAPLLTAVFAVIVRIVSAEKTVPHGPSMCVSAGAAVALVLLSSAPLHSSTPPELHAALGAATPRVSHGRLLSRSLDW